MLCAFHRFFGDSRDQNSVWHSNRGRGAPRNRSKMFSSKAMKLMGIGGGRGGKHPHQQIISRCLEKDWCLLVDDYSEFWADMESPDAATVVLCELLKKVIAVEQKGLDKIHESLIGSHLVEVFNSVDLVKVFVMSIVHTIHYIGLFFRVDPKNKHYVATMDKWASHESKTSEVGRIVDAALREIQFVGKTVVRSIATPLAIDLSWFSNAVAGFRSRSSHVNSFDSTHGGSPSRKLSNGADGPASTFEIETMMDTLDEFPFGTVFAKRVLRTEGGARALFDATIKLMQALPQRLKMGTETTVRSMCALDQMLLQMLIQHPVSDSTALRSKLLPSLEAFCMWPCPYGQLARRMRAMVEAEIRSPGTLYRHCLFEEHPILSLSGIRKQNRSLSMSAKQRQFVWSELQQSCFMYFNPSDGHAVHIRNILQKDALVDLDQDERILCSKILHQDLRKRMIRSMLESTLDLVHDFNKVPKGGRCYTDAERDMILRSGGWMIPNISSNGIPDVPKKNRQLRSASRFSRRKESTDEPEDVKYIDPLSLDDASLNKVNDWYVRILSVFEAAAEDTELPLTAYTQMRASYLIPIVKEMKPDLVAIPTACPGAYSRESSDIPTNEKSLNSSVSALKQTKSFGKAVKIFKKSASRVRVEATTDNNFNVSSFGPPQPPPVALDASGKPMRLRDGFALVNKCSIPPIKFEFQDSDCTFVQPQVPLYQGPLSARMEKEVAPPKPPKSSDDKRRMEKEEKQHKDAMSAMFGDWKRRCVIGHTKKRYLKYPEARYNPICDISGDLLVAALYAGSVDLQGEQFSAQKEALSSVFNGGEEDDKRPERLPESRASTTQPTGIMSSKRDSLSARRKIEEGYMLRHLSTTRSASVAKHAEAAAKTRQSVIDASTRQSILRLCIMGDDSVIHRILCSFVSFHHEFEERFKRLSIRIFIVPTSRHNCQLASYLAREDAWYRRQIFAPFCAPIPIVPRMQPSRAFGDPNGKATNPSWDDTGPPIPELMLHELLQDYIRSARYVAPICVFDCECWEPKGGNTNYESSLNPMLLPDMTIPFCLGMEIGILSRADLYRRNSIDSKISSNNKDFVDKDTPLSHVLLSKYFRRTWEKDSNDNGGANDITLSYTEVGPSGNPTGPTCSIASSSYFRIALRNVSLHAEAAACRGAPSHPGLSHLDMHILESKSANQFSEILQRHVSVSKKSSVASLQKDADSVMQSLLSEGRRLQVTDLEIASLSEFHVLIDGELIGPFSRVRIRPCIGKNGEPVYFPVSTFSPLSI